MKTCNIIIPTFDNTEFILECIESVYKQEKLEGWKYIFLIGVDGCKKTAEFLIKRNIPFYLSPENITNYGIRNSLMYQFPADAYAYFDSDDVMFPNYIKKSLIGLEKTGIVMVAKINCDIELNPKKKPKVENGGAMTFTDEVLKSVGGFKIYKCAADTDFMRRVEMAGYEITKIKEPLYYRRSHPKALTKQKETGMGSPYRKQSWAEMCKAREKGIYKIEPMTIKMEMVLS